jgi:hypothetical protein
MDDQLTETKTVTPLDVLEKTMFQFPQVDCPLVHRFTDGMYIREIFMPGGTAVTTLRHKTNHPFVITRGRVSVWNDGVVEELQAPYVGITNPGTRRLIIVHEDTVWITFHNTEKTDPDEIAETICEVDVNPMLDENDHGRAMWRKDRRGEVSRPEEINRVIEESLWLSQ